ncbi:MAG: hypothetical protein R3C15_21220 [Thermoleophilia bacterium]
MARQRRTAQMLGRLGARRPSPALVLAAAALFLALGGSATAGFTLGRNSVGTENIKPGAVKRSDIGPNAVDSSKLVNGSVRNEDLATGIDATKVSGKVGQAVTADAVAGHVIGCPAGTTPALAKCFEAGLRPLQAWFDAAKTCADAGRRLPETWELAALQLVGFQLGNPELSAEISLGGSPQLSQQTIVYASGQLQAAETATTKRQFRCVASPVS